MYFHGHTHSHYVLGPTPDGIKGGGRYGPAFQRHLWVTHGEPLSPNIFIVDVDAVIRHWATVVGIPLGDTGQGLGESIQTPVTLLYADDGLVASPDSAHLQRAFDALTCLFDQVGLRINDVKMVSIACRTCHTPHAWSMESYTQQVAGRGLYYKERICQRVLCPECGFELVAGLLAAHRQQQQGFGRGKVTPL